MRKTLKVAKTQKQERALKLKSAKITSDILGLVGLDVPPGRILTWTKTQIKDAEKWAGSMVLDASDNEGIQIPAIPEHIKKIQTEMREAAHARAELVAFP